MMNQYDHLKIHCLRLGHELSFAYCRIEAGELPCRRTLKCWQPFFPVAAYLQDILSKTQWDHYCSQTSEDKLDTLITQIEKAKLRLKNEGRKN